MWLFPKPKPWPCHVAHPDELAWHRRKAFPPRRSPPAMPSRGDSTPPAPRACFPPSPAVHSPRLAPGLILLFHPTFQVAFTQRCSRTRSRTQAGEGEGRSKPCAARCGGARAPGAAPRGAPCLAPSSSHLLALCGHVAAAPGHFFCPSPVVPQLPSLAALQSQHPPGQAHST